MLHVRRFMRNNNNNYKKIARRFQWRSLCAVTLHAACLSGRKHSEAFAGELRARFRAICAPLAPYLPSRTNYRGRSVNISEVRKWDVAQVKSSLYDRERGRRDWWHAIGHTHISGWRFEGVRSIREFVRGRQYFREITSHCSEVFGVSVSSAS